MNTQQTPDTLSALQSIVQAIVGQAPVITDSGMMQVWLDAKLLEAARAAIAQSNND